MSRRKLTVRLSHEVKQQLARLSAITQRTSSSLAVAAISSYVSRETEIVDGIKRGLADIRAGRVVPHSDAMEEIDHLIDERNGS